MALRYLARKVGIPALRCAPPAPRVSPSSAGASRPLTSGPYQLLIYPFFSVDDTTIVVLRKASEGGGMDMDAEFAEVQAQLEASREAIKKSIRDDKINRRLIVGAGVAAVAFTWVITEPGLI